VQRIIVVAAMAVGAVGWSLFRPERLFINRTVNEPLTVAVPEATGGITSDTTARSDASRQTVLASGRFHSNAHETTGTATVLTIGEDRVLRLTDFATSNGPDVRVYLVAADDVNDDATVKAVGFVELGPLKGNRGNQNYVVPSSVDLTRFRTVTIWCKRFSVNFGSAPLVRS
jgi:hypothetical protein